MGADVVKVKGCNTCPFAVKIVEGAWCQHPIQKEYKNLTIQYRVYDSGGSPEECPLGEVLIVKEP